MSVRTLHASASNYTNVRLDSVHGRSILIYPQCFLIESDWVFTRVEMMKASDNNPRGCLIELISIIVPFFHGHSSKPLPIGSIHHDVDQCYWIVVLHHDRSE